MKKYIDRNGQPWNGSYIVADGKTIVNPTEEILFANGYTEVTEPEKTAEELLAEAKAARIAEVEAYDASVAVNVFYLYGQPMWLDFDERSRILASISAYRKLGRTDMTKVYGGVEFTFPLDTWESLLAAVEVYASECLNVTERHKRDIMEAATMEDVSIIDITAGYPEKLTFTPTEEEAEEAASEEAPAGENTEEPQVTEEE